MTAFELYHSYTDKSAVIKYDISIHNVALPHTYKPTLDN